MPARSDVSAETLFGGVCTVLWLLAGQPLTLRLRRWWAAVGGQHELGPALPLYLLFLTAVSVLPLDLTLSPADLYHTYKEGRVVLVPFASVLADAMGQVHP